MSGLTGNILMGSNSAAGSDQMEAGSLEEPVLTTIVKYS